MLEKTAVGDTLLKREKFLQPEKWLLCSLRGKRMSRKGERTVSSIFFCCNKCVFTMNVLQSWLTSNEFIKTWLNLHRYYFLKTTGWPRLTLKIAKGHCYIVSNLVLCRFQEHLLINFTIYWILRALHEWNGDNSEEHLPSYFIGVIIIAWWLTILQRNSYHMKSWGFPMNLLYLYSCLVIEHHLSVSHSPFHSFDYCVPW